MAIVALEGWCTDPYGLHEARWISAGSPTKLVRDGAVEAYEPVPATPPRLPATPLGISGAPAFGHDLLRSDQVVPDPRSAMRRAAAHMLVRCSD